MIRSTPIKSLMRKGRCAARGKRVLMTVCACFVSASFSVHAETPVTQEQMDSLKSAYRLMITGSTSEAMELYRNIRLDETAPDFMVKAAMEGEGIALLNELRKREKVAESNRAAKLIAQNARRQAQSFLADLQDRFPSETSAYLMALANAEVPASAGGFEGLTFAGEYNRLEKAADVAAPKPNIQVAPKKLPKPAEATITATKKPPTAESIKAGNITQLGTVAYYARKVVNVRSGPGTGSSVEGQLKVGQRILVEALHIVDGNKRWLKFKGKNLFVSEGLMQTERQYKAAQAAATPQKKAAEEVIKSTPQTTAKSEPQPTKPAKPNNCRSVPVVTTYVVKANQIVAINDASGRLAKNAGSRATIPSLGVFDFVDGRNIKTRLPGGRCGYISKSQFAKIKKARK